MAMDASEIDQVVHLIDRSKSELQAELDTLRADFDSLYKNSTDNYAWRRAQASALTRAVKIRTRWIAVLAVTLIAQTVAVIVVAI